MKLASVLSAAILCFSAATIARADIVVNTGGNINCVTTKGETGFEAYSFTVGGMNTGTPIPGKGVGAGKPQLSTLDITKNLDSCSAQLLTAFLMAKSLPSVTLTQYRVSGQSNPFGFLMIQLTHALVSNYTINSGGQAVPSEAVSLSYQTICVTSIAETASGLAGQTTKVCYDSSTNVVVAN